MIPISSDIFSMSAWPSESDGAAALSTKSQNHALALSFSEQTLILSFNGLLQRDYQP